MMIELMLLLVMIQLAVIGALLKKIIDKLPEPPKTMSINAPQVTPHKSDDLVDDDYIQQDVTFKPGTWT